LVIRAVTERVLAEPKALPAHPEPYDLSPAEVRALPRWPRNQFTGRVA
jgi:hypothetical protein